VAVQTVLERAASKGKSSGEITDVEIDDATPAAWASHVTDRGLGFDISTQMAQHGIETLFGGGDGGDEAPLLGLPGVTYVKTQSDLQPYFAGLTPWPSSMYGIIGRGALVYDLDREEEGVVGKQPTLPQFTDAALRMLQRDSDGFFLMVEGGAIDWGGHARDPGWIGAEVREFDQAVKVGYDWAKGRTDTLLVVVSDHETGGLDVTSKTDYEAIGKQTATTEWMWGLIRAKKMTIEQTLATCAGITDLSTAERNTIDSFGEMGISDVLAARDKVTWGWAGTDEGDHTARPVPVRAWGPGATVFNVNQVDNEFVGQQLLKALGN
jgi:alkaline phosphatase